ncbi:MAG TPA: Wzz/FepE/Etk N-terminal domain-containing protein, partial [Isosphaeraceae bacterium]|nr:Wzz/FepE/Etk N-terminal domain-containing protein [Isosphaeraceae bacterium]
MAELAPPPPPAGDPRELDLLGEIKQTIGVLRRGWRQIGISTLICLTVAVIYLAKAKRIYQAEVRLLVLQQGGRPLNVANTDPNRLMEGTEDYIPTHILIISSPQVVKRAIDKVGLDNLPSLLAAKEGGLDPIKEAIKNLKVTRPDRLAQVLRVEYRAGGRDEAARTAEAIT